MVIFIEACEEEMIPNRKVRETCRTHYPLLFSATFSAVGDFRPLNDRCQEESSHHMGKKEGREDIEMYKGKVGVRI